jgi:hypothetical protein
MHINVCRMCLHFFIDDLFIDAQADDRLIEEEGVESLTLEELKETCRDRGLRSFGLTAAGYANSLHLYTYACMERGRESFGPLSLGACVHAFL